MNLFYEEGGAFKAGKVLQEQGSTFQVETQHGKRTKVKSNQVLITFTGQELSAFMHDAETLAAEVDTGLLWECAPEDEFGSDTMAELYFGEKPSPVQKASVLMALHASPVYFHRKGKGRYRAAPQEILKAALAGLEKKRLAAEQQAQWAQALVNHELPDVFARQAALLLAKPDKSSLEYKALTDAASRACCSPEALLLQAGAFSSIHDLMKQRFCALHFPRGTQVDLPLPAAPAILQNLPVAKVRAFSIDDISTTEIDDAFSVSWPDAHTAEIGIHIAAPALFIVRGSEFDKHARDRMSTVYAPGDKITMLPDNLVELSTLAEGRTVPAVSLYVRVKTDTGELQGQPRSVLERVEVAANLRHNLLDEFVTLEALEPPDAPGANQPDASNSVTPLSPVQETARAQFEEFLPALQALWKASCGLRKQREIVRGQPEKHSRVDYNFYVNDAGVVEITPRRRDAPLDLLVAEWMIFVNMYWGGLLHQHAVAGIYRVQPPAGRVKMSTHAGPHAAIGVPQYAWSTSPLRRYVDLINQQQLVSVLTGEPPVYQPSDSDLLSALNSFDISYKAYADFQDSMERYWCLRWVRQTGRKRFEGVVVRDELVRLHEIPLFVRLVGVSSPGRGAQVEVELDQIDELTLTVSCRLISIQQGKPTLLVEQEELTEPESENPAPPSPGVQHAEPTDGLASGME
ncbi:MAG: RNB domain-containing ribonuclease [Limnobacter sp.]|nr:RNB domain-containing ribonuclease [Limnobacter sp.]